MIKLKNSIPYRKQLRNQTQEKALAEISEEDKEILHYLKVFKKSMDIFQPEIRKAIDGAISIVKDRVAVEKSIKVVKNRIVMRHGLPVRLMPNE